MTRRSDDLTPEPPGGRASERLRMFQNARRPPEDAEHLEKSDAQESPKPPKKTRRGRRRKKKGSSDADKG
jgi:hypothetical protein